MNELPHPLLREMTAREMLECAGGDAYSVGLRIGRAIRDFFVYASQNLSNPRYTGDWQG